MYEVEIAYGSEVTMLQSRISNLEVLVCELLAKMNDCGPPFVQRAA